MLTSSAFLLWLAVVIASSVGGRCKCATHVTIRLSDLPFRYPVRHCFGFLSWVSFVAEISTARKCRSGCSHQTWRKACAAYYSDLSTCTVRTVRRHASHEDPTLSLSEIQYVGQSTALLGPARVLLEPRCCKRLHIRAGSLVLPSDQLSTLDRVTRAMPFSLTHAHAAMSIRTCLPVLAVPRHH